MKTPLKYLVRLAPIALFAVAFFLVVRPWVIEPPLSKDPRVRQVETYAIGKSLWRIVLVPPGLGREELVSLAREMRENRPHSSMELFDDDARVAEYVAWVREHLAREDRAPERPFPDDFVRTHRVGVVARAIGERVDGWCVFRPGDDPAAVRTGQWTLAPPPESVIAMLE